MRSTTVGSIKISSMSNIVTYSGIHHGIRRIKPYVLTVTVANHGLVNYSKLGRHKYRAEGWESNILVANNLYGPDAPTFIRRLEFSSWKQCLSRDDASVAFYYAITYRIVPTNGHKSRWLWRTTPRSLYCDYRESRNTPPRQISVGARCTPVSRNVKYKRFLSSMQRKKTRCQWTTVAQ